MTNETKLNLVTQPYRNLRKLRRTIVNNSRPQTPRKQTSTDNRVHYRNRPTATENPGVGGSTPPLSTLVSASLIGISGQALFDCRRVDCLRLCHPFGCCVCEAVAQFVGTESWT